MGYWKDYNNILQILNQERLARIRKNNLRIFLFKNIEIKEKKIISEKKKNEIYKYKKNIKFDVCSICGGLPDSMMEKIYSHKNGKLHKSFLKLLEEIKVL